MSRTLVLLLAAVSIGCSTFTPPTTAPAPSAGRDAAGAGAGPASAGSAARGPKPYAEVVTDKAVTDSGLFNVHRIGERYLYEIPDSLLGREMLLVSRIAQATPSVAFGGESLQESVIKWERVGDRLLLRYAVYANRAADSLPIAQAVRSSNIEPILQAFAIAAVRPDSQATVVDVSTLFTRDVPLLGLSAGQRTQYQVRRLDDSRSLISNVRSFPLNVEVRNTLTYDAGRPPANAATGSLSLGLSHSMVLLPATPMRGRYVDRRMGYFAVGFMDYGNTGQRVEPRALIRRWRLEPRDTAAFRRGQLTEPIKPIVFYIDPATPMKYRRYLKEGVNAWQRVFETAGFRNAIFAMDAPTPEQDPDWSPEDARYSVIRYFASPIENAYGPSVVDPRSGEIIESDIGWFHNVTNLFATLFRLQVGAVRPEVLQRELPDEVMGDLIRYIAAHEVGHTLGLAHAHGVNLGMPVDSLRSPTFTSRLGTSTPSIMDYARYNYVAQPGDGVTVLGPWIGPYDHYIINWGYRPILDVASADAEQPTLDRWIRERADDPMMRWVSDADATSGIDPTAMSELIGDDPIKATTLGLANLKRVAPRIAEWTAAPGVDHSRLDHTQGILQWHWGKMIGHVVGMVGGRINHRLAADQPGREWTLVPKADQVAAMRLLNTEVWTAPQWLVDPLRTDRIEAAESTERLRSLQHNWLNQLLDFGRMQRLIDAEAEVGNATYTLSEMLTDLRRDLWREAVGGQSIGLHRRMLQRAHIDRMGYLMTEDQAPAAPYPPRTDVLVTRSDIRPLVREELLALRQTVQRAITRSPDAMTRAHLRDAEARITTILDPRAER